MSEQTGPLEDQDVALGAGQKSNREPHSVPVLGAPAAPETIIGNEPDRSRLEFASVDDFQHTEINRLLETVDTLDFFSFDSELSSRSRQALANKNYSGYRAYRVLMVVCSYHFSVDRQDAFGPRLIRDGMRTPIPADIAGEQSQALATIAEIIDHPLLRARVADVAWYNHRNLHRSAGLAITSYCQTIEFYLDDKLSFSYEQPCGLPSKVVDLIERAFHIVAGTGKRKMPPEIVIAIWNRLYTHAEKLRCFTSLDRLARLGQSFNLIGWPQVAQDAERSGNAAAASDYTMAVKIVWELAAMVIPPEKSTHQK